MHCSFPLFYFNLTIVVKMKRDYWHLERVVVCVPFKLLIGVLFRWAMSIEVIWALAHLKIHTCTHARTYISFIKDSWTHAAMHATLLWIWKSLISNKASNMPFYISKKLEVGSISIIRSETFWFGIRPMHLSIWESEFSITTFTY